MAEPGPHIDFDLRRHTVRQVGVRAVIVALFTVLMVWMFYQAGLREQSYRLIDIAQSRAALIKAIAVHAQAEHASDDLSDVVRADTLGQLRAAHLDFRGLGETGEFTLARREGDRIVFLLRHRHDSMERPEPVAIGSRLAEPMRRALAGREGTVEGLDYRGAKVLAAHQPIPELGWGIVAKIDLAEIRAPYLHVGAIAVLLASLVVSASAFLAFRSLRPFIRALELSENRYRILVENQSDLVVSFAPTLKLTFVSNNYCETFGRSREELLTGSFIPLIHHEDRGRVSESLKSVFAPPYRTSHEERAFTVDGWRWFQWSARALLDSKGRVVEIIAVGRDITDRKREEEHFHWLARHDGLTELPNRTFFEERCAHALARARRTGEGLALLFIDLDHFKPVNDDLGHTIGDLVLQAASRRILDAVREEDTVTRIGGDEFVVLLEDDIGQQEAAVVAEKILGETARPFEIEGRTIMIGASIGIAVYPGDGMDPATLIDRADAAMYVAKRQGRGRMAFASSEDAPGAT